MVGRISGSTFFSEYNKRLITSFTSLKVKFKFPDTVKYPNLPVRLDFNSVIFPLEGETFCTGVEFYLAMQLDCQIEILGGIHIPFSQQKVQHDEQLFGGDSSPETEKEIFVRDPFYLKLEQKMERLIKSV